MRRFRNCETELVHFVFMDVDVSVPSFEFQFTSYLKYIARHYILIELFDSISVGRRLGCAFHTLQKTLKLDFCEIFHGFLLRFKLFQIIPFFYLFIVRRKV